ncbi:hypothetical protein K7X08_010975 [Anisodus acutangulus]|uniref:Uncharacterized protein n=1 Tax=Anisodus acutangulus TaxID=402998 RepID=A0A9Q1M0N7_9SOLA|nr:hypothetical protein K7X08_010975 [Anisodus acutangulus]
MSVRGIRSSHLSSILSVIDNFVEQVSRVVDAKDQAGSKHQSMISTLITESVETEERLNVVCDEVSTVIFRIKGFPTASNGGNAIAYESPSDSLILAVVEDSEGIGQSFTCNPHECINLGKLKERGFRDGLDLYGKRRRFSIPCCGQYGHDANEER